MSALSLDILAARGTELYRIISQGHGKYEPEVFDFLLHLFDKTESGVLVNVGSNIGLFPLIAAKFSESRSGRLDIYAHEPLPYLQEIARVLQKQNGLHYSLSSVAVSDFRGSADFFVSARSDASNSLVRNFRPAKDVISVQVDTLDNLYLERLQAEGSSEILFIIDVETAEPAVLRGCKLVMERVRPIIICEVLAGRTEDDLSKLVAEAGYVTYRFDGAQWLLESSLFGDTEHKHRDWIFAPAERAKSFGRSFRVPCEHQIHFLY